MKRLFKLLFGLFAIYILVQVLFQFISGGYETEYEIHNDYNFYIKEKRVQNEKNEKDNYYFEITVNDTTFSLQTYEYLKNVEKILDDIKYYDDGTYKCILPIAKDNKIFTDLICKYGNIFYPYQSIKGINIKLDEFVQNLELYNPNNYIDSDEVLKDSGGTISYSNFPDNFYLGLEDYKGLYYGNSKIIFGKNRLFEKDIYTKDIGTFIKNYYVVGDYNEEYEFHNFYVIDIVNGGKSKITSNHAISMYSYINGVVDNSVYLFDISSKKQYEINVKTRTIIEVGNENTGVKYYNLGTWENKNIYDAINNKLIFNHYTVDSTFNGQTYVRVDKNGNEKSGYYYLYEAVFDGYNVYRVNVQNLNNKTFLFKTSSIDNIVYIDDYVVYKDSTYIKYYHDLTGVRKLVKCEEIIFNNSLKFGVYKR